MFEHVAGDIDTQAQALQLYMLLLLTWLAGYPPAVRACLSVQPFMPVLVTCIKARLVQTSYLTDSPPVNVVLARPTICYDLASI